MALPRSLITGPPALNRHALSKEFCRRIGWYKADGGYKDMMARVVMLAMHRDGRIELPPPKWRQNRPGPITFGPDTEPPLLPPPTTLDAVRPLEMRTVVRGDRGEKRWNEYVARYHYLGYKTVVGAQMRYAVHASVGTPLAMLGFSTAAWTLAPRDRFIGWSRRLREKNLPLVVDNPRFLILPWIRIPNLGSHILALVRRQLPADWTARYKTTPVLIETFVETPRYTGAVYRASGWIRVGATQGRGRYNMNNRSDKPKKDIWLRPLRKDWKRTLNPGDGGDRISDPSTETDPSPYTGGRCQWNKRGVRTRQRSVMWMWPASAFAKREPAVRRTPGFTGGRGRFRRVSVVEQQCEGAAAVGPDGQNEVWGRAIVRPPTGLSAVELPD